MTQPTIREIHDDEMLEVLYALPAYAFHASPPLIDKPERQELLKLREGVRYFALFEGSTPVACGAFHAMVQNVRDALLPCGGVYNIVTVPAARRKGYARRLTLHLLAEMHEGGRPVSCLYPFRESFYERLGYVTFPQPPTARFSPLALQSLLEKDLGGDVEVMLIRDGFEAYRQAMLSLRAKVHGMAVYEEPDRVMMQRNRYWLAIARAQGEVVGCMLYNLSGEGPTGFNLHAYRFYYHTSQGKYLLLAWLARHADQARQVEIELAPGERPETWLSDLKVTTESPAITPMGRVVEVSGIRGLQTGPGEFTARISDPTCPWNEGIWRFETTGGTLQVSAAEAAGCKLSIQGLSALVYGTHNCADFAIRGWGDPLPEIQVVMSQMFPAKLPYLHENF